MSRIQLLGLLEGVAVMIALIMPVTPSRTRGDWDLGQLLFAEPTYLQSVAAYFVPTNLLLGLVAAVFWLVARGRDGTVD